MPRADKIALIISTLAILVTAWISLNIFEGIAHLEDEFAYIWQAQVIARGELTVPSPPEHKSFLVPFVVDYKVNVSGNIHLAGRLCFLLGSL